MARILIVYESKYGQTEKISRFIADKMKARGHSVDLLEAHAKSTDLSHYRTIIVGGPVYANGYPRALSKWVKNHSGDLNIKEVKPESCKASSAKQIGCQRSGRSLPER